MSLSIMSIICIYVLSNTYATFEAQFMKNLSSTEAQLKKALLIENASTFLLKGATTFFIKNMFCFTLCFQKDDHTLQLV